MMVTVIHVMKDGKVLTDITDHVVKDPKIYTLIRNMELKVVKHDPVSASEESA